MPNPPAIKCSFCQRPRNEVKHLIGPKEGDEGAGVLICNRCIMMAHSTITAGADKKDADFSKDAEDALRKPKEIREYLDGYVISQEKAKIDLSVAIYNHFKRRDAIKQGRTPEVEIDKANILLLGPTGTGKTHLARTVAKMLKVPFFVGDATRLTQAGYVGDDVESLLQGLVRDAGGDIEKAEWGIIYIDEIDKIARTTGRERAGYRDVSGEGVQQALLKLLEGSKVSIPREGSKAGYGMSAMDTIDTTNILFICAGSFAGIEDQIKRRVNTKARLGFGAPASTKYEDEQVYKMVTDQDILDFGIIPELKGRLQVMTSTYHLSEDEMLQILVEPKNSTVKQIQALFALDNVKLEFEDAALRAMAKEAKKRPMGARALRSIAEATVARLAYDIPSDPSVEAVTVTEDVVLGKGEPVVHRKEELRVEVSC